MVDGKTIHGGMSDRFRGLLSVYNYCKKNNKSFYICWTHPFKIQDYLIPNIVDWIIKPEELCFNRKYTDFKFFNSFCSLNNDIIEYHKLLDSNKPEVHVYSNVTIDEPNYHTLFNELFKIEDRLSLSLTQCMNEIGNEKYVSVTFRFIGLLGDFKDHSAYYRNIDEQKKTYINKCLNAIDYIHKKYCQYTKILVTSDSRIFLEYAKTIPYVYVIPGDIIHVDFTQNNNYTIHQKSFLDFFMISKAEMCFIYSYGEMFKYSKFAYTASLINNRNFVRLTDEDIISNK